MDSNQFAQQVKQKYPQYASVPNDQLTQAVVKKYPQYQSMINPGGSQQMPQMQQQRSVGQSPVGQPPPQNGINPQQLMALYQKIDPQGAQKLVGQMVQQKLGGSTLNPLQQAQADYYKARASQLQGGGQQAGPAAYVSDDGDVSTEPKPGYKPVNKQQLQFMGVSKSSKERDKALSSRAEVMARGIDARQIDKLATTVGITPAQRNLLQQNNMRANRAVELASKPMTWQEFGAVTTDAAAIMQGGSPQVQQLHDMSYPSWKQDLARAQTYMQSTPQATVPDAYKNRIIDMIKGIQQVDNRYLQKNAEFQQKMLAPTIRGGVGQFKGPIQDMTKTITETGGGQTGTQPYSDPAKEARYQAWKASQGQ